MFLTRCQDSFQSGLWEQNPMILTRGLNISIHLFDEVSGQFKHHLSLNRTEDLSNIPSATFMFAATLSNKLKQTHPRWCFLWSILWRSEKQVMKFNINGLKHRPTHTGAVRFVCFVRWIEPLCSLTAQKRKGSSDKVNKERKLCKVWLWAESGQLSHRCDGETTHCVLCCWLTTCY